jgi:spore coat protein H
MTSRDLHPRAFLLVTALAAADSRPSGGEPGSGDKVDAQGIPDREETRVTADAGVTAADAPGAVDRGIEVDAPPPDAAGAPDVYQAPPFPREVDGRIVINEIMASNGLTLKNEAGLAGDWIELYNPTTRDVPLAGYSLTDDFNVPAKFVIAAGVVVKAGAHLLLWLDGATDRGPAHLPLRLPVEGGSLGLARPDGSFISKLVYGAQETDFSAAREPDGSDRWVIEWHPSPAAANPSGSGRPLTPSDAPEQVPPAGDLSQRLLGDDALPQLRINISSDGISRLEATPTTYVPGTLVFDGRSYGPVGVRLKGSASFEPINRKPSFRINVNEYVPDAEFFGLQDLTLNNMHDDHSMMRERMAYWIARTGGVPASRSTHATVSLNGETPALYAIVETVKRRMLRRWFRNPDGPLYEATDVDFTTADRFIPNPDGTPRDAIASYELKSKVDDRSTLYGLARALTLPSADMAMAAAAAYINVAEFQSYWAVVALIGQFDGMPYSMPGDDYYVYVNPEDGKIQVFPWGVDETFNAGDIDIVETSYSVMARTCAASPACLRGFVDRVWALLDKLEAMNWEGERARIAQLILPLTRMDRRKSYTDTQVATEQDNLRYFLRERRMTLGNFLPPPSNR